MRRAAIGDVERQTSGDGRDHRDRPSKTDLAAAKDLLGEGPHLDRHASRLSGRIGNGDLVGLVRQGKARQNGDKRARCEDQRGFDEGHGRLPRKLTERR